MAVSSGFFDGDAEYGQAELNRYFENLFENGVALDSSGSLVLGCSVSGTTVTIAKGFAIINGFFLYSDSNATKAITRDTNYTRIDRIVVRLDLSAKTVTIEHKQGAAGSSPTAPALTRSSTVYELSLCQIKVPVSGNLTITDERAKADLCGTIRPRNMTELNNMMQGFEDEWEAWFDEQQATGWRNIYIQSAEPTGMVSGSIWIQEQA